MSAPNTDPEKQAKRHKIPLLGMAGTVVWAAVLLIGLIVYLTFFGNEPGDDVPIGAQEPAAEQTSN